MPGPANARPRWRPGAKIAVISDENVDRAHGGTIVESLAEAGIQSVSITVPPGESSKCFAQLVAVSNALLDARIERGDLVLALGGGVVGDLAGFAAAILRRGVRFVQVPTSLLAQVDSSVGGKTGIDTGHGKNLIGAFHQPALVLADTGALATLSDREFRAGYAEVAKYGLIDDADFFDWLAENRDGIFSHGPALGEAIAQSCRAKARVVMADEYEHGARALLNLGHTFGHALEAAVSYDAERLVHGEAIAIGMVLAFGFSARLGLCNPADEITVRSHLDGFGLPTALADVPGGLPDADTLVSIIGQDKKVERGTLTFILARGVGKSFIAPDIDPQEVREFLSERLNTQ